MIGLDTVQPVTSVGISVYTLIQICRCGRISHKLYPAASLNLQLQSVGLTATYCGTGSVTFGLRRCNTSLPRQLARQLEIGTTAVGSKCCGTAGLRTRKYEPVTPLLHRHNSNWFRVPERFTFQRTVIVYCRQQRVWATL